MRGIGKMANHSINKTMDQEILKKPFRINFIFIFIFLHFFILALAGYIRWDHFLVYFIILGAYFANARTRDFIQDYFPIAVIWLIYDSQKIYANWLRGPEDIFVAGPYLVEKKIFSFFLGGKTPSEAMAAILHPFFDILAGILYSTQVFVPMFFTMALFWYDRIIMRLYGSSLLVMNLMGYVTYYLVPAAPPWYVEKYGFAKPIPEMFSSTAIPGSVARLSRFDDLFGINFFQTMYSYNSNYFGAIPSLHAAFPFLIFLLLYKRAQRAGKIIILFYVFGMAFSAVYLNHHYTIDILWGWVYALLSFFFIQKIKNKISWLHKL
jgi:membrane-associated phospholipid phosphatase